MADGLPAARAAVEAQALRSIVPDADEAAALAAVARRLEEEATQEMSRQALPGRAAVQGSVAKGTWLRGGTDIDLFLLLDPALPAARLESAAVAVGARVLQDGRRKYAQHPYLTGRYQGHEVDVVPAYAVATASAKMSAVDRTPFHTAWVRGHLDAPARDQVRLAKKWLKGIGAYGAETAVGGFSGYLVEVLVARFGSFAGLLDWLAADLQPRRIAVAVHGRPGPDQVKDDVAPLVVVDPVDAARNCAAAVTEGTMRLARDAARAYLQAPSHRFFTPNPARAAPPADLHSALSRQGTQWVGVLLRPEAERMDIVYPQFQRAARTLAAGLRQTGFKVQRSDDALSAGEDEVLLQFLTDGPLPPHRQQPGPPLAAAANAQQFRAKWTGHPDAQGPVQEQDGRLVVQVANRIRTAAQWLRERLPKEALGKHAQAAARTARVLDDPAQAPPAWAPRVADFVLARNPWER